MRMVFIIYYWFRVLLIPAGGEAKRRQILSRQTTRAMLLPSCH